MTLRRMFRLAKTASVSCIDDNCPQLSAALSYYSIFSLAPLLLLAIAIAGFAFGQEAAQGEIIAQFGGLLGPQSAAAIQTMIEAARKPSSGILATLIGLITFLIGASGIVIELKNALNKICSVENINGGIWSFLRNRLVSMAMVLGIGFLLLVSLIISAALAAIGKFLTGSLPLPESALQSINLVASFAVITVLFAMLYKFLPDLPVRWRDVWIGAAATSFLFSIGKLLIGLYIGKSSIGSSYGAAGSLIVLLIWVYYSSLIFYWGAEFTKAYSQSEPPTKITSH